MENRKVVLMKIDNTIEHKFYLRLQN